MKKIFLLGLIFLIKIFYAQNSFIKTYTHPLSYAGYSASAFACKMQQTSDSGYVMILPMYASYLTMQKVDKNGAVQYARIYMPGNKGIIFPVVIRALNDGCVIMGSAKMGNNSDPYTTFLLRVNNQGGVVFYKTYNLIEATDFICASDGGFLIVGVGSLITAIKTDNNGVVQWSNNYFPAGFTLVPNGSMTRVCVKECADTTGYIIYGGVFSGIVDPLLLKITKTGTLSWAKTYANLNVYATDLCLLSNGDIALTGLQVFPTATYFMLTNGTGNIKKAVMYDEINSIGLDGLSIDKAKGGYLIAGSRQDLNFCTHPMMFFVDSVNYSSTWEKEFGIGVGFNGVASKDGGFAFLAGWGETKLIKTDSVGDSDCSTDILVQSTSSFPAANIPAVSITAFSVTALSYNVAASSIYPSAINGCSVHVDFSASDTVICEGTCISFFNKSLNLSCTNNSFQWYFPGASPSSSILPSPSGICYATQGTYSVTLIVSNGLTSDTLVKSAYIKVADTLVLTPIFSNPSCVGGGNANVLMAVSGGNNPYSFLWSTGQTSKAITNLGSGLYSITVTSANGCTTTKNIQVVSSATLFVQVGSNPVCGFNNGVAFAAGSGGSTPYFYQWSTGAISSQIPNLSSQSYSITLTDANGCTATGNVAVIVYPNPVANAGADKTITPETTTLLNASGGIYYLWKPSAGLSCNTCSQPAAAPIETTKYCVEITDLFGCKDSACTTITVELICGDIFVPGAFSPNEDNENDILYIYGNCIKSIEFFVYDRWGKKIFETSDPKQGWNGSAVLSNSKKNMETGVYMYNLHATLITGETVQQKGNINLIR